MATKAGSGEHRVYKIPFNDSKDKGKLTARLHYVAVDAVAWYINKESSWFTEKTASGILEIKLSGGLEEYQTALGTFKLKKGSKIAPIFEIPVLPERNYRGGEIILNILLTAIKKDTILGSILKSAADASLNIVSGMVETAGLKGPSKILTDAGNAVIGGVREILSNKTDKYEPLFDPGGLRLGLHPYDIIGKETYLLFHRGAPLQEDKLSINTEGQLLLPFYNEKILDDGAWIMLRIRRSNEYSGVREWDTDTRALRRRIKNLVDDFFSEFISKEDALKSFELSSTGKETILDEFMNLRSIIGNDGVLTEWQAGMYVGHLSTRVTSAKQAIKQGNKDIYNKAIERINAALLKGKVIPGVLGEKFEDAVKSLAEYRNFSIVKETPLNRIASFSANEIFENMKYLPNAIKAYSTL